MTTITSSRFYATARLGLIGMIVLICRFSRAQPAVGPADATTNGMVWSNFFSTLQQMTNRPLPELLNAAQAGNDQAQYAYWVRETAEACGKRDRLFDLVNSNESRFSFQEQQTMYGEQKAMREKWAAAPAGEAERAAATNDYFALDFLYSKAGQDAIKRGVKAFVWLEKSADQGFAPAEFEAAMYYMDLSGWEIVQKDRIKGSNFLTRAAGHAFPRAQYQLAKIYLEGTVFPPDLGRAIVYFQKAVDQGNTLAQLYANGNGRPRGDWDSPVALLRKAAQNGNLRAMHALGDRLRTGMGTPVDYVQAMYYYDHGRDGAISTEISDGLLDEEREPRHGIVPEFRDYAKAYSVYWKAAGLSNAVAQIEMGDMYATGRFVPKDDLIAFRWYDLAAASGNAIAIEKREHIKTLLSPEQKIEAQQPPGTAAGK
jgi:TPR repeat protein